MDVPSSFSLTKIGEIGGNEKNGFSNACYWASDSRTGTTTDEFPAINTTFAGIIIQE